MRNFTGIIQIPHVCNSIAIMILLTVFTYSGISAQSNSGKQKPGLNISAGLTTYYDNNILKYSDKYIDRFLNNQDEGRFHIKTYDDMILSPEIELSSSYRLIGKLNTTLSAGYKLNAYIVNSNVNRSYWSLGLRQYITRKSSIKISWEYIPEYYVRHFRDDDWVEIYGYTPETFKPFSFSKDNYGAEFVNTFFRNTRLKLIFDYSTYYYNSHFTEYDCNNKAFEVNLRQPLNKNIKAEVSYTYTLSKAKGYDEPGESKQDSDDSDGSFEDDSFLVRVFWELPELKKHKHSLDAKIEFGNRYYTSDKSIIIDPLHAGRFDKNLRLNGTYSFDISKSLALAVFCNWFGRNASSVSEENKEYISGEKDYQQSQIGLSINYSLKL
ncbi:MAG: hypothetical protein IPH20_02930 [Bacteroidales bacterium]|nr:hypothetical protein [Bacteroidales bacterium]